MNLLDPFGRMHKKRERQYASLRDMFRDNGVDTVEAAELTLVRMRKSMAVMALVLLLSPLAVQVLAPSAVKATILIAALLLMWLLGNLYHAHRNVRRYIREELQDDAQPPLSA